MNAAVGDAQDAGLPSVVLGAGYAGLAVWHAAHRRARGRFPILLVDRHPVHVVRTELYRVGRLAATEGAVSDWALPLRELLDGSPQSVRTAVVEGIDLAKREVRTDGAPIPFRELAICLGSVPSYYGVPGATTNTFDVYRLSSAQKLAQAIRERLARRPESAPALEVVVVGGGSTGTEVAAEIATTRWSKIVGRTGPPPHVTQLAGALPFLAGLPAPVVEHARALLARAGVLLDEGRNVLRVDRDRLSVQGGAEFAFDLCVWAAGVQAPDLVRALPVAHGRSGRLRVAPTLELPEHPGVFGVGDVAEWTDPVTGISAPATAQAALAEAPVAGANLVARRRGNALRPFVYREKGVIVALGIGAAAGSVRGLTVWGRPAALLKSAVQEGHRFRARSGGRAPGL